MASGPSSTGTRARDAGPRTIKVDGVYVSLQEIEDALTSHNIVLEALAFGENDGRGRVRVSAFIVLPDDEDADVFAALALKLYVRDKLAPRKRPWRIYFVSELPRSVEAHARAVKAVRHFGSEFGKMDELL